MRARACGAGEALVEGEAFGDLLLDGVERVERGHRLLEDEADVVAAGAAQGALVGGQHLGAAVADGAGDVGVVGEEADGGEGGDGLAGAGFADERQGLAGVELEADAADGRGGAGRPGGRRCREVADGEERARGGGACRCPSWRFRTRFLARPGRGEAISALLQVEQSAMRQRHAQVPAASVFRCKTRSGAGHRKVFRGSKASRTPSKMKTRSESMVAKVKKAVKPSQGALRRFLPWSASSPREG